MCDHEPGLLTSTIPTTVRPRKTSSETRRGLASLVVVFSTAGGLVIWLTALLFSKPSAPGFHGRFLIDNEVQISSYLTHRIASRNHSESRRDCVFPASIRPRGVRANARAYAERGFLL